MKYFLIAGEASGDLHASHLITALRQRDPEAEFRFYGGDLMAEAATGPVPSNATAEAVTTATVPGASAPGVATSPLLRHYKTLAYMGFVQVALHAHTILSGLAECKAAIADFAPHCIILIDYPGFNLKIARWAKQNLPATPIYYYISPKIWAWKEHRIKDIRANVDRLFSILPFEVDFYERKHHYPISYVGNPTYDEVAAYLAQRTNITLPLGHEDISDVRTFGQKASGRATNIALFPGSRKQEIADNLPIMLRSVRQSYGRLTYRIFVCCAPGIDSDFYSKVFSAESAEHPGPKPEIRIWNHTAFALLRISAAALVTSGTATLEAALLDVPQVVCYKMTGGRLVNKLRPHFLKCRFISLVNLIADAEVVPELIAADMNPQNVARHLDQLLPHNIDDRGGKYSFVDSPAREAQLRGYALVRKRLASPGAPQRAAEEITGLLKKR